jgi:hypothetical protein
VAQLDVIIAYIGCECDNHSEQRQDITVQISSVGTNELLKSNALQGHVQQLQELPLFDPFELLFPLLKHLLLNLRLPSEQFNHPEHIHNWLLVSLSLLFITSETNKRTFTDPLNPYIGPFHPFRLHAVDHCTNQTWQRHGDDHNGHTEHTRHTEDGVQEPDTDGHFQRAIPDDEQEVAAVSDVPEIGRDEVVDAPYEVGRCRS